MSVFNAYSNVYGQAQQQHQQHQPPQAYQQQYQGYYPPPANLQPPAYDENGFRSFYSQRLGALTVNSRPIIQDLSMLAQTYPHMAHVVVDCIERQVRMVSFSPFFSARGAVMFDQELLSVYNLYSFGFFCTS